MQVTFRCPVDNTPLRCYEIGLDTTYVDEDTVVTAAECPKCGRHYVIRMISQEVSDGD